MLPCWSKEAPHTINGLGELLTEKGALFDPLVNLLKKDVLLSRDPSQGSLVSQINIMAPKEDLKG